MTKKFCPLIEYLIDTQLKWVRGRGTVYNRNKYRWESTARVTKNGFRMKISRVGNVIYFYYACWDKRLPDRKELRHTNDDDIFLPSYITYSREWEIDDPSFDPDRLKQLIQEKWEAH